MPAERSTLLVDDLTDWGQNEALPKFPFSKAWHAQKYGFRCRDIEEAQKATAEPSGRSIQAGDFVRVTALSTMQASGIVRLTKEGEIYKIRSRGIESLGRSGALAPGIEATVPRIAWEQVIGWIGEGELGTSFPVENYAVPDGISIVLEMRIAGKFHWVGRNTPCGQRQRTRELDAMCDIVTELFRLGELPLD